MFRKVKKMRDPCTKNLPEILFKQIAFLVSFYSAQITSVTLPINDKLVE